jgi:ectoine hydroxylase-related dioxygenase (phytanoyl-CoA dioxygenase family)
VATIARFAASAPAADIAAAILRDGAVIADGVLSADLLARFNAEIDRHHAAEAGPRRYMNDTVERFFGTRARHIPGIAGKSEVFLREILCHPLFTGLCDAILRPNCSAYQLNFADVMERGPGAEAQLMHRDDGIWPHFPRPLPFPLEFATMVALGDFTAEMGATLIVPGSHRWPPERTPEPHEIAVAVLEPGSAALYLGSTLHAGGPNSTADRWRRGMHLSYCLGWLRTEENNYLIAPLEKVRGLPRPVQAMLGYAIHDGIERNGGFLGAVDWRDPLELIAEGRL